MASKGSEGADYRDRWIRCTPTEVQIRAYYVPWGTKRIPYGTIKGIRKVAMGAFTGRGRIWGSSNPRYWASLDPARPGKQVGLILDLGRRVKPFITPDDPDAVERTIRARAGIASDDDGPGRAPVV
ncbi:MAG TPA: hypothetical protein VMF60_06455 [Acidimicrobiales bacterium]|nr:hypothetical protein [Acidimicrobiales bacterium]